MLHVNQHERDGVSVVALRGEAGVAEAQDLSSLMIDLAASRPSKLIFDLTGLTFISSLALGEMASLAGTLQRFECKLAIAAPTPLTRSAIRRVRLDRTWDVFDTLDQAVAELNNQSPMWFVFKQPSPARAPATS